MLSDNDIVFLTCLRDKATLRVNNDYLRTNAITDLIVNGYVEIDVNSFADAKYEHKVYLKISSVGREFLDNLNNT